MKTLLLILLLLATPAAAQTTTPDMNFTTAPAVAATAAVPTPDELNNAFGICQAHRDRKTKWRAGYENCEAVEKAMGDRTEDMHRQTVDDVVKRLGKKGAAK